MGKLLIFWVLATLAQLILVWALTHYGLILIGVGTWAMWSWWKGRSHA